MFSRNIDGKPCKIENYLLEMKHGNGYFPYLDDCPSYKPPLIAEDHQPYHRTGDHTPYTAI